MGSISVHDGSQSKVSAERRANVFFKSPGDDTRLSRLPESASSVSFMRGSCGFGYVSIYFLIDTGEKERSDIAEGNVYTVATTKASRGARASLKQILPSSRCLSV